MTYADTICIITINITDLAGPSLFMLSITVIVINAPITPPKSIYFGLTFARELILSLPVISHAIIHTINALNWTKPADTHRLVCFVTPVFITPCTLISSPDIKATIIPHIKKPPITGTIYYTCLGRFYSYFSCFFIYASTDCSSVLISSPLRIL